MTILRRALLAAACAFLLAPGASAGGGHPKLNAYFQPALTDAAYQQKAFARVASKWKQPVQAPVAGGKAVVQALIGPDGKLLSAHLSMASGSKQWDAAALAAVQKAAPFDRFPATYRLPTLEAHFHVSYEK